MNKRVVGIIVVTLFTVGIAYAGGTVTEHTFFSEALGTEQTALVYLPENYPSSGLEYPVVYLLHGADGGIGAWYLWGLIPALDEMIGTGIIEPVIVVEPVSLRAPAPPEWQAQGFNEPIWHYHTNSELNGNYEDYLAEDVVEWIDRTYRTIDDVDHRWLLARSAGGHGAMRLALLHSDVFSAASIDAGFMAVAEAGLVFTPIVLGAASGPPYTFSPTDGFYTASFFALSAAFAPNPDKPPWYVDFLLDENGNVNTEVHERLLAHSPPALVHAFADSGLSTDLFFRIGDEDEYGAFFWPVIDALEEGGLPYTVRVFEGAHFDTPTSEKLTIHLTYLDPIKATMGIGPHLLDSRGLYGGMARLVLELPGDLDVADIDCSTLKLLSINDIETDLAIECHGPCEISDINGNDRDDLSVWLPCSRLVCAAYDEGACCFDVISLTVRGELNDGRFFRASGRFVLGADPRNHDPID